MKDVSDRAKEVLRFADIVHSQMIAKGWGVSEITAVCIAIIKAMNPKLYRENQMSKPDCFGTQKSEGKCGRCPWENLCGSPPHDGAYFESLGYNLES